MRCQREQSSARGLVETQISLYQSEQPRLREPTVFDFGTWDLKGLGMRWLLYLIRCCGCMATKLASQPEPKPFAQPLPSSSHGYLTSVMAMR